MLLRVYLSKASKSAGVHSCEPRAVFLLYGCTPALNKVNFEYGIRARFVDHLGERRTRNAEVDGLISFRSTKEKVSNHTGLLASFFGFCNASWVVFLP